MSLYRGDGFLESKLLYNCNNETSKETIVQVMFLQCKFMKVETDVLHKITSSGK